MLPRLQGLPLLPIGAGRDGKAPIDPSTGRGMSGWQQAAYTPEEIGGMPGSVTAVGMRWGPDADGLVCFDLDGQAALDLMAEAGCEWSIVQYDAVDLATAGCGERFVKPSPSDLIPLTWCIHRRTAPDRLKVVWRVSPSQWPNPADKRYGTVFKTTADGGEVRAFWSRGQAVVGGLHRPSQSYLKWHGGPEDVAPLPDAWLALWRSLEPADGGGGATGRTRSSKDNWRPAVPCPICGRRKDNDCQIHREGQTVLCHHGQTHRPPSELKVGEQTAGGWAYCGETTNAVGHCSVFKQHQPRERERPALRVLPDPPRTIQDRPGPSAAGVLDDPGLSEPVLGRQVSRGNRVAVDEVLTLLPDRLGTLELDIRSGDVHSSTRGILQGNEIARLYLELSSPAETWGKESTADGVLLIAGRNAFDPVQRYLDGITVPPLPMEQWERLDHHLLGIDDPIARQALPRFLIAAVARTFEPGCYVRQVPVLIGPQERGKSALGCILFGAPHWVEGIDAMDKDARMRAHTAWGVELAELDGVTRRRDQEQLKAFLTEAADTFRKPYDRAPERYPRKFVFWGTANRPPLRDSTGSTRFVCIGLPDQMLPLRWAIDHRDALWARAVQQYRAGVPWCRTDETERAAVEERNAAYVAELDPWGERISEYLKRTKNTVEMPVTVSMVLDYLEVDKAHQNPAAARRVREIAEAEGWTHARRLHHGFQRQGFWPPA